MPPLMATVYVSIYILERHSHNCKGLFNVKKKNKPKTITKMSLTSGIFNNRTIKTNKINSYLTKAE